MSTDLSPAQTLPADVLHSIFKWVIQEMRLPFQDSKCEVLSLKELLTVSSAWRQVALECLWRQLKLYISFRSNEVHLDRPEWVKNNSMPYNAANLVRVLHVNVPVSGIVGGIAHKLLVDYVGDTKSFPFVGKLIVGIEEYKGQDFELTNISIANALEFAKLLKSMTPATTTVNVICYPADAAGGNNNMHVIGHTSKCQEEILRILSDVLYTNTKYASLDMSTTEAHNLLTIDHMPPLSWLSLHYTVSSDVHASLVRKSASTLQYLDIGMRYPNKLIYDIDGEAVLYPSLQQLRLRSCVGNGTVAKTIPTKKVLFPVLRALRLLAPYPFIDDVLFRGNSDTLEYLDLFLIFETIVKFNQWRVFEGRHKVLRYVFVQPEFDHRVFLAPEADMTRFLNGLVSGAKKLVAPYIELVTGCITAAPIGHGFQNLQVLVTYLANLSLNVVLTLLKAFPALVELRCGIWSFGPELENIAIGELPDHIASTYCDVGQNMQVWIMNSYDSGNTIATTDYILLLALVCPKLWKIDLTRGKFQDTRSKLINALNRQPYSKYAHRLNRIIDTVCE